jgi:hypothetical protein
VADEPSPVPGTAGVYAIAAAGSSFAYASAGSRGGSRVAIRSADGKPQAALDVRGRVAALALLSDLSMAGRRVVFLGRDERSIHAYDVTTGRDAVVGPRAGIARRGRGRLEGRRVSWAEGPSSNAAKPTSDVRALTLGNTS